MTNEIPLTDGAAVAMGDGVYVLIQPDEAGVRQNVVVTADDLRQLMAALG